MLEPRGLPSSTMLRTWFKDMLYLYGSWHKTLACPSANYETRRHKDPSTLEKGGSRRNMIHLKIPQHPTDLVRAQPAGVRASPGLPSDDQQAAPIHLSEPRNGRYGTRLNVASYDSLSRSLSPYLSLMSARSSPVPSPTLLFAKYKLHNS